MTIGEINGKYIELGIESEINRRVKEQVNAKLKEISNGFRSCIYKGVEIVAKKYRFGINFDREEAAHVDRILSQDEDFINFVNSILKNVD